MNLLVENKSLSDWRRNLHHIYSVSIVFKETVDFFINI
jgi:hypothetical protein